MKMGVNAMQTKMKRGKATVKTNGDVTTVRVVDYRGQSEAATNLLAVGVSPSPPDLQSLKHLDLIAFNVATERVFVQMLERLCAAMPDGVPVSGARAEAAYSLNISTETAKRYIEKFCCAFSAPFQIRDGMIFRKDK